MRSEKVMGRAGVELAHPFAFWSGTLAVLIGVAGHFPMYWRCRPRHFAMVGMHTGYVMLGWMSLIWGGVGLVIWSLLPRASDRREESTRVLKVEALDDAPLGWSHYALMLVLGLAIAIDTLKPFTFTFIIPGVAAEYGLSSPAHPLAGALSVSLLPLGGILGTTIGSFIWGDIGDRLGRRASLLLSAVIFIATSPCGAMPAYWMNVVMCLAMGFGVGGLLPIAYSLLSETIPARLRGGVIVLTAGGGTALGFLIASGAAALLIHDYSWRIMWFLGFPTGIALIALNRWFPESPRFLGAMGRVEEARHVMERFGVRVVTQAPEVPPAFVAAEPPVGYADLFRPPLGALSTAVCLYGIAWGLVNFGFIVWLPFDLAGLGMHPEKVDALIAMAALYSVPGTAVVAFLYERWSSKKTMILFGALTSATLVGFALLGDSVVRHTTVLTLLVMSLLISMWGVISALSPYSSEIYPTLIRARGSGLAAGASKLGGVIALAMAACALSPPGLAASALLSTVPVVIALIVLAAKGKETRGLTLEQISGPYPALPPL